MKKKAPPASEAIRFFSMSEESVDSARKRFEETNVTLTSAWTYAAERAHVTAAGQALAEAAEVYAKAMQDHARLVVEYAEDRSRG